MKKPENFFETINGWENQVVKLVVPNFAAVFGNNYSEVMLTLPILSCLARHFFHSSYIYQQLFMTLLRQVSLSEES
jgi:hypothetical protein